MSAAANNTSLAFNASALGKSASSAASSQPNLSPFANMHNDNNAPPQPVSPFTSCGGGDMPRPIDCYVELVQPRGNEGGCAVSSKGASQHHKLGRGGGRRQSEAASPSQQSAATSDDVVLNFRRRDRAGNGRAFFLIVHEGFLQQLRSGERGGKALRAAHEEVLAAREDAGRPLLASIAAASTPPLHVHQQQQSRPASSSAAKDAATPQHPSSSPGDGKGGGSTHALRERVSSNRGPMPAGVYSFYNSTVRNEYAHLFGEELLGLSPLAAAGAASRGGTAPNAAFGATLTSVHPSRAGSAAPHGGGRRVLLPQPDAAHDAVGPVAGRKRAASSAASSPSAASHASAGLPSSQGFGRIHHLSPLPSSSSAVAACDADRSAEVDAAAKALTLFDECVRDPHRLKTVAVQSSSMLRHTGAIETGFATVANGCGSYTLRSAVVPETNYKVALLIEYDDEELVNGGGNGSNGVGQRQQRLASSGRPPSGPNAVNVSIPFSASHNAESTPSSTASPIRSDGLVRTPTRRAGSVAGRGKQKVSLLPCVDTVQLRFLAERTRPVGTVATVRGTGPWQYPFLLSNEHAQSLAATYSEFINGLLRRSQQQRQQRRARPASNAVSSGPKGGGGGVDSDSDGGEGGGAEEDAAEATADAYANAIDRYLRYDWAGEEGADGAAGSGGGASSSDATSDSDAGTTGAPSPTVTFGASARQPRAGAKKKGRGEGAAPPPFTPTLLDARVTIRGVSDPLCGRYISLVQSSCETFHKLRWMMRCDAKAAAQQQKQQRQQKPATGPSSSSHSADGPVGGNSSANTSAMNAHAAMVSARYVRAGVDADAIGRYSVIMREGAGRFAGVGGGGRSVAGGGLKGGVNNRQRRAPSAPSVPQQLSADTLAASSGAGTPPPASLPSLDPANFSSHSYEKDGDDAPPSASTAPPSPRSDTGALRHHHVSGSANVRPPALQQQQQHASHNAPTASAASPPPPPPPPPPLLFDELAYLQTHVYPPPPPAPSPGAILECMAALGCAPRPAGDLAGPWVLDWYDYALMASCGDEGVMRRVTQMAAQYNAYEMEGESVVERLRWMCLPERAGLPPMEPNHHQQQQQHSRPPAAAAGQSSDAHPSGISDAKESSLSLHLQQRPRWHLANHLSEGEAPHLSAAEEAWRNASLATLLYATSGAWGLDVAAAKAKAANRAASTPLHARSRRGFGGALAAATRRASSAASASGQRPSSAASASSTGGGGGGGMGSSLRVGSASARGGGLSASSVLRGGTLLLPEAFAGLAYRCTDRPLGQLMPARAPTPPAIASPSSSSPPSPTSAAGGSSPSPSRGLLLTSPSRPPLPSARQHHSRPTTAAGGAPHSHAYVGGKGSTAAPIDDGQPSLFASPPPPTDRSDEQLQRLLAECAAPLRSRLSHTIAEGGEGLRGGSSGFGGSSAAAEAMRSAASAASAVVSPLANRFTAARALWSMLSLRQQQRVAFYAAPVAVTTLFPPPRASNRPQRMRRKSLAMGDCFFGDGGGGGSGWDDGSDGEGGGGGGTPHGNAQHSSRGGGEGLFGNFTAFSGSAGPPTARGSGGRSGGGGLQWWEAHAASSDVPPLPPAPRPLPTLFTKQLRLATEARLKAIGGAPLAAVTAAVDASHLGRRFAAWLSFALKMRRVRAVLADRARARRGVGSGSGGTTPLSLLTSGTHTSATTSATAGRGANGTAVGSEEADDDEVQQYISDIVADLAANVAADHRRARLGDWLYWLQQRRVAAPLLRATEMAHMRRVWRLWQVFTIRTYRRHGGAIGATKAGDICARDVVSARSGGCVASAVVTAHRGAMVNEEGAAAAERLRAMAAAPDIYMKVVGFSSVVAPSFSSSRRRGDTKRSASSRHDEGRHAAESSGHPMQRRGGGGGSADADADDWELTVDDVAAARSAAPAFLSLAAAAESGLALSSVPPRHSTVLGHVSVEVRMGAHTAPRRLTLAASTPITVGALRDALGAAAKKGDDDDVGTPSNSTIKTLIRREEAIAALAVAHRHYVAPLHVSLLRRFAAGGLHREGGSTRGSTLSTEHRSRRRRGASSSSSSSSGGESNDATSITTATPRGVTSSAHSSSRTQTLQSHSYLPPPHSQHRIGGAYQKDPHNPLSAAFYERLSAVMALHRRAGGGLSRSAKPLTTYDAAQRFGEAGTVSLEAMRAAGRARAARRKAKAAAVEAQRVRNRVLIVESERADNHGRALRRIASSFSARSGEGGDAEGGGLGDSASSPRTYSHQRIAFATTPPAAPPRLNREPSVRFSEGGLHVPSACHEEEGSHRDSNGAIADDDAGEGGSAFATIVSSRASSVAGGRSQSYRSGGNDEAGGGRNSDEGETAGHKKPSLFSEGRDSTLKGLPWVPYVVGLTRTGAPAGKGKQKLRQTKSRKDTQARGCRSRGRDPLQRYGGAEALDGTADADSDVSSFFLSQCFVGPSPQPIPGFALAAAPSAGLCLQHQLALELLAVSRHRARLVFFLKWARWAQSSIAARERSLFLAQTMRAMMATSRHSMMRSYYTMWRDATETLVRQRNRGRAVRIGEASAPPPLPTANGAGAPLLSGRRRAGSTAASASHRPPSAGTVGTAVVTKKDTPHRSPSLTAALGRRRSNSRHSGSDGTAPSPPLGPVAH